jgi:hypothetical protein
MKPIYKADNALVRLMDEIGFFFQSRVGIPRFHLVPLLTLIALLSAYYRTGTDLLNAAGTMLTFACIMFVHVVEVHKKGAATDDLKVNLAVEGLRNNPIYLFFRAAGFVMFVAVVVAQALTAPSKIPLSFVEFLFLFYPLLIYQHEPPARREFKLQQR